MGRKKADFRRWVCSRVSRGPALLTFGSQDFIEPITDSSSEPEGRSAVAAASTPRSAEPGAATSPPAPTSAPAPPSPKVEPVALLAPSTAAPAPTTFPAPSTAAPTATTSKAAQPAGGDDDSPSKQSMKDRLAFFAAAQNKPAPPPIKAKPATGGLTWSQRQKMRQEQEAKERDGGGESPAVVPVAASAAAVKPSIIPVAAETPEKEANAKSGLSAADAQTSISQGGSLRERMAALKGAGAFGSPGVKNAGSPAPSGKVWQRPAAPEPQPGEEGEDEDVDTILKPKTPAAEAGSITTTAGDPVQEGEEGQEEEVAKAKRAAIAARMAKLGARGPIGMAARPTPARKPTQDAEDVSRSPVDETPGPVLARDTGTAPTHEAPATSPPPSIPIASLPRRAAPPRRRGQADAATTMPNDVAEPEQRIEGQEAQGIEPPPQVMISDEERPLPKTDAQMDNERQVEDLGRGMQGAEGAASAGIAVMPVKQTDETEYEEKAEPVIGVLGAAGTNTRGLGSIAGCAGPEEVVNRRNADPQGSEEGEGTKDDLRKDAEQGKHSMSEAVKSEETMRPEPATMVPLQSPAEDRSSHDVDEAEVHPPLPPRMMGLPLDEVELKHAHEAVARGEEDEPGHGPPNRHPVSADRPLGPRPLPTLSKGPDRLGVAEDRPLPAPPIGNTIIPPQDDRVEEREMEGEGDNEEPDGEEAEGEEGAVGCDEDEEEVPAPPPPRRQPSLPAPLQTSLPTLAGRQMSPVTSPGTLISSCPSANVPK